MNSVRVLLAWDAIKEVTEVNNALRGQTLEGHCEFLINLLRLWNNVRYPSQNCLPELHKIFGSSMDSVIGSRCMFTISPNRKQFRCWYGIPGMISQNHVESSGEGLLFTIEGEPHYINQYVNMIIPQVVMNQPLITENGATIYGIRWR